MPKQETDLKQLVAIPFTNHANGATSAGSTTTVIDTIGAHTLQLKFYIGDAVATHVTFLAAHMSASTTLYASATNVVALSQAYDSAVSFLYNLDLRDGSYKRYFTIKVSTPTTSAILGVVADLRGNHINPPTATYGDFTTVTNV